MAGSRYDPTEPHPFGCDCGPCEDARDDGLPTDGSCAECRAPYRSEHLDGCSGQFREDRVGGRRLDRDPT